MNAREENRQAIVSLSPHDIEFLLGLPDGVRIQEIHTDWNPKAIILVVASAALPAQPNDVSLPYWPGVMRRTSIRWHETGLDYHRFNWDPTGVPGPRGET